MNFWNEIFENSTGFRWIVVGVKQSVEDAYRAFRYWAFVNLRVQGGEMPRVIQDFTNYLDIRGTDLKTEDSGGP